MKSRWPKGADLAVAILLILAFLAPRVARADDLPPLPTPERFDQLINQGKDWLYSKQANGNWETSQAQRPTPGGGDPEGGQWGGYTALVTYTLLAAGEDPKDPRLAQAIQFLKQADITGIYALGMRANVWGELPHSLETRQLMERDAQTLYQALKRAPAQSAGFYNYTTSPTFDNHPDGRYDHSVSQIGVLGMWAAYQYGLEIPGDYWQLVENAWLRDQDPSGGWMYMGHWESPETTPLMTMTAAGVATLLITQECLHGHEGVNCPGNIRSPAIEAGMKYLADHMDTGGWQFHTYTWYGISRIGVAAGYKYFGTIDWFRAGCKDIAGPGQGASWDGPYGGPLPGTCFALLFLCRGRAPVMLNKLQYQLDEHGDVPKPANWHERTRDAANLVKWASEQTELFMNWQIVNLQVPIEDLHDAPILYIAGDHQGLSFTPAEEDKLRLFVEQGGLILGNSDCGSRQFTQAFEKLGNKLFPDYEFRRLPADHLLFHNQFDSKRWRQKITVDSMSNGARELMMLFPTDDPSRFWQTRAITGHEAFHEFMINLWLYVTDKGHPLYKGETYLVTPNPTPATRTIKVARLQYGGNWNPEPGGWRRLAAWMHNFDKCDLDVQTVPLGHGKLAAFKVAHLTGTTTLALTAPEQDEIKKFVAAGGTLIIDACGGLPGFSDSAQQQLGAIFGADLAGQLARPLKPDHPALQCGTLKISLAAYRRAAAKTVGGPVAPPRLRGIEIDGRLAVVFSPEDLSAALVGQSVDGIYGYQPNDGKESNGVFAAGASQIMASLLLYADGTRPPTTKPAVAPASAQPASLGGPSLTPVPPAQPATAPMKIGY